MSVGGTAAWRTLEGSRLVWRLWEDEYVVFDAASGDIHLLDLVSGEVLKRLAESPAEVSRVVRDVASTLELEPDRELFEHVEQALARFETLGLIEPGQE